MNNTLAIIINTLQRSFYLCIVLSIAATAISFLISGIIMPHDLLSDTVQMLVTSLVRFVKVCWIATALMLFSVFALNMIKQKAESI